MRRDSTTYSANQPNAPTPESLSPRAIRLRGVPIRALLRLIAVMAIGALLLALAYQIPVTHTVDVGGYDAAYVQGFYDPERALPGEQRPELAGSDGGARWTRDQSFLVFPQAGLPAQIILRLRGWRANGASPQVTVLLNGVRELGQLQAGADWQDYAFTIDGGLLKPNDVVIEIRSDTAQLDPGDPRRVGVLLDRATYRVGPAPIVPYPPQLLYGALAAGMLWVLIQNNEQRTKNKKSPGLPFVLCLFVLCSVFLVFYRLQPPYPYPLLRLLPALDGVLAALLALRYGSELARRIPMLLDALALGGLGVWLAAVLVVAQRHVTLSVPSVEKDFRVFALRSAHLAGSFPGGTSNPDLDGVLRADGFYNLGYPLLLWLARPFTGDNPFLAARLVAALSAALLLGAAWWLARRLLGRGPALLALLMLALSPLVVEYALYVGTDMPFAALCVLALALLVPIAGQDSTPSYTLQFTMIAAGVTAGAAFLIRHPGLLLLPFGYLCIWLQRDRSAEARLQSRSQRLTFSLLLFTLAFLITISLQLYVNFRDAGAPLYSQQAKNVWQAVFGDGDWGRWGEANDAIGLGQVIAQDPARFLANWWANLRGFVGTGGEDTREFGQAAQLRLLGFPANWLAIVGLLGWLLTILHNHQSTKTPHYEAEQVEDRPPHPVILSLPVWITLYVVAISVGLPLQGRFLLPLAPIYAIAAAWVTICIRPATDPQHTPISESTPGATHNALRITHYVSRNPTLLVGIVLVPLLWGGFTTGAEYVVRSRPANEPALARAEGRAEDPGQPADELAIVQRAQALLKPGERLIVRAGPAAPIGKYSAIAHLVAPAPAGDDPAAIRASGARYLIWSAALGPAPSVGAQLGVAGIYSLFRIE